MNNIPLMRANEIFQWLEDECGRPLDPNRPRLYCGTSAQIPPEYVRRGTSYECLKKGVKTGICSVHTRALR